MVQLKTETETKRKKWFKMGCLHQVDIKRRSLTWYTVRIIAPLSWRWGRISRLLLRLELRADSNIFKSSKAQSAIVGGSFLSLVSLCPPVGLAWSYSLTPSSESLSIPSTFEDLVDTLLSKRRVRNSTIPESLIVSSAYSDLKWKYMNFMMQRIKSSLGIRSSCTMTATFLSWRRKFLLFERG